jgi:hypothetical protein
VTIYTREEVVHSRFATNRILNRHCVVGNFVINKKFIFNDFNEYVI